MHYAAAALAVALLGASAVSPVTKLDGVPLGGNVRAAIAGHGDPEIVNTDIGHVWTWKRLRITTDDDGTIRVIDTLDGSATADALPPHPAKPASVTTGTLPGSTAPSSFWDYPLPDGRDLILAYDLSGSTNEGALQEMFLGERDALTALGLIPPIPTPNGYKAPVLLHLGAADAHTTRPGTAYTRILVGPDGSVRDASIFVSSGDADFDQIALATARRSTFTPATQDGKPIASVYFRREDLVVERP